MVLGNSSSLQRFKGRCDVRRRLFAVHHFVGQRETVESDHQRNHDLQTVRALIATVTVLGFGVLFHRTFKVRAGQVLEQHFEVCLKQIGPLLAQPQKQVLLVFQHSIQTAIPAIFLSHGLRGHLKTGQR